MTSLIPCECHCLFLHNLQKLLGIKWEHWSCFHLQKQDQKKKKKREKIWIIKMENGCFGIYSYEVCVDLYVVVVLRLNHDWIGFVVVVYG
jgi:hypothetical protein